ncbi:hypothetical protein L3Q72_10150 [Vibrio sp. JC009]|uniref:ShlB/FhaC/HecB family hemolysin secretion/activation protein n=1 Tax=Vibrio sp. JC009 TaxID=2912314 RepID=UPI0023AEA43A|nr:ShlB/FhaC/HecB family hemolysin secretion/activation protein [Vibrio sp. JC009]WED21000.1 hypothetical protein L3Q72_10150 [Vibrio sp. JC009]
MIKTRFEGRQFAVSVLAFSVAFPALGANTPDAGQVLRDAQLPSVKPETQLKSQVKPELKQEPAQRFGPFFQVFDIEISGSTLFLQEDFTDLKQMAIGPKVSISDLDSLCKAIDHHYVLSGYLAKTSIPEQDITSGHVVLKVTEGKLGDVVINTHEDHLRFSEIRAEKITRTDQPDSGLLNLPALRNSMQVLNNMPGVNANARLVPSQRVEGTDVIVGMENSELTKTQIQLDNHGSRSTGRERALGTLVLDGPFGFGDRLAAIAMKTEGIEMLQLSGSVPVSDYGSRLSAFYSTLNYEIVKGLDGIDADGKSESFSLQYDHPRLLAPAFNSNETVSFSSTQLEDYIVGVETSDKDVNALSLSSRGTIKDDQLFENASPENGTYYLFTLTGGRVDLSGNASDLEQDEESAGVHGSFSKLNFELNRSESFISDSLLRLSLKGQLANENLDSSQQMSLGGAYGVRGYPVGEASGSTAFLAKAQVHKLASETLDIFGFLDAGWVRLNENKWDGWESDNSGIPNEYALYSFGAGANWQPGSNVRFNAMVAHVLGPNPGADSNGNNADGKDDDARLWLQLVVDI